MALGMEGLQNAYARFRAVGEVVKWLLVAACVVGLIYLAAFVRQSVREFSDLLPDGVTIVQHRKVADSDTSPIPEVEDWEERVAPCEGGIAVLVPPGTAPEAPLTLTPDEPVAEQPLRDRPWLLRWLLPQAKRTQLGFEKLFAGKIDLNRENLHATLDLPPSRRRGWVVAATSSKVREDDEPVRIRLTAAERSLQGLASGYYWRWWAGVGPGAYLRAVGENAVDLDLELGFEREAFTVGPAIFAARLVGEYGWFERDGKVKLLLTVGGEGEIGARKKAADAP